MSSQLLRFLVTGGFAALVNLASRYVLNFSVSFEVAVAIAYLIGMITAYALSRLFVFDTSGRSVAVEFGRFAIVNAFALVLVWLISVGLARYLFPVIGFVWHAADIAHLIGVSVPAFTSFLGHRYYTFAVTNIGSKQ